jgi:hypothetical protein
LLLYSPSSILPLFWAKFRLLGLTAAFTIMGGAGTTCVALAAEKYDSMFAIAPYKWLYVIFVIATIAAGVLMARATVMLVRRKPNAYRDTIIALIAGIVIGIIHMVVSRNLRGSSMPVDAVTYTAILTLIVFLLFKIPVIWEKVDYTQAKPGDNETAGGVAAIVSGGLAFTIQYLMASTHTMNGGINYGDAFHTLMTIVGLGLVLGGISLILAVQFQGKQPAKKLAQESTKA